MNEHSPEQYDCTVVIPTIGRKTLLASVASALGQRGVNIQVVVVMNGAGVLPDLPNDDRLTVEHLEPGAGGNAARNFGISLALADVVALLDDDDWWHPRKVRHQLDAVRELGLTANDQWLLSCRLETISSTNSRLVWPRSAPGFIDDVPEYLFRRRSLLGHRAHLQSSTLMFPRDLALVRPFDEASKIHQDWEWVINVCASPRVICFMLPQILTSCQKNDPKSITKTTNWEHSLDWGMSRLPDSILGDFTLGPPLRFALTSSSWRGVGRCLNTIGRNRPSFRASVYATLLIAKALMSKIAHPKRSSSR